MLWQALQVESHSPQGLARLTQAVEDMGQMGNTLIICISGDNGFSPEGTLPGAPNEVATQKMERTIPFIPQWTWAPKPAPRWTTGTARRPSPSPAS